MDLKNATIKKVRETIARYRMLEKGERVKVFIVLEEGETITETEIRAFCCENLTPYKIPKFVEFRDALPVTPFGKVLRRVLSEEEARRQKEVQR